MFSNCNNFVSLCKRIIFLACICILSVYVDAVPIREECRGADAGYSWGKNCTIVETYRNLSKFTFFYGSKWNFRQVSKIFDSCTVLTPRLFINSWKIKRSVDENLERLHDI